MAVANPIKERKVGIANICRNLTDLIAENSVYVKGQPIWAIDALDRLGLKIGRWDPVTQDISDAPAFVDLPWALAPEASGVQGINAFKVRTTDNVEGQFPFYQVVGADVVITDPRLLGVDDPLIASTSGGGFFRDGEITIDAVHGKVTLIGFPPMDPTDMVAFVVPSVIKTADSVDALLDRLTEVELLTAPFLDGGGKVWWTKPLDQIPTGWRECTDMQGVLPLHYLPGDPDIGLIGERGGSRELIKLTPNNLPRITVEIPATTTDRPVLTDGAIAYDKEKDVIVPLLDIGKDDPDSIDTNDPYVTGCWIELDI